MHWRSLIDRIVDWRNRLQASPGFRDWAASFPLTRPIARRRARALFDLCAGFVYSQVLLSCVQLRVFEILAEGPQTTAFMAARMALPIDAATRLLDAAVSLDLVAKRGKDRYGLGSLGSAMIGNAGLAAMIEHHVALYADLHDPVSLLRGKKQGRLAAYWPYAQVSRPDELSASETLAYSNLMSASQCFIAREILAAYNFKQHRCLLDIGGGDGTFLEQVAAESPDLDLMLFDLPSVAAAAAARFDKSGIRARAIGGDAKTSQLPIGADVISFVRVLHDHDDTGVLSLLRASHAALSANGTLLIAEPMSGTPGAEPIGDAYFGFYFMAMGQGRSRTPEALQDLLRQAGFRGFRQVSTRLPMLVRIITAKV